MITINPLASSSRGNCYWITDGQTPLLVEAGISFPEIRKRMDFKTVDLAGCLVSHDHQDHSRAVREVVKAGINCYMSPGTAEAIAIASHRIIPVKALEQFEIGTWSILPFDTEHDCREPLGYLLVNPLGEKLLFATDTYFIRYCFNGLTHIMVECNYSKDILEANVLNGTVPLAMKKRLLQSHFSLAHVKEFLQANDLTRVQEIWLLHLSDGNSDEARFKREIQELTGKMVLVAPMQI